MSGLMMTLSAFSLGGTLLGAGLIVEQTQQKRCVGEHFSLSSGGASYVCMPGRIMKLSAFSLGGSLIGGETGPC